MLPPSWLPWQDSLSLTLRPAPEIEKKQQKYESVRMKSWHRNGVTLSHSALFWLLKCFPTPQLRGKFPLLVHHSESMDYNIIWHSFVPDTFFHNSTVIHFIWPSKWYNSYLKVALKSEKHKSRHGLEWDHGLAVRVWYFQGLPHKELIFNDTISMLNNNSNCLNRTVISTWEKMLSKYSLNPHLARTGALCFPSTGTQY